MPDQYVSTGERTGQAVEVFFIHTRAKKDKIITSILISLIKPPPLAVVQVIRMSFISFSTASHTCTHVHGDMNIHTTLTSMTHTLTNTSYF